MCGETGDLMEPGVARRDREGPCGDIQHGRGRTGKRASLLLVQSLGIGAHLDLELGQQAWSWDKREEMLQPIKKSPFAGWRWGQTPRPRKRQTGSSGPPYRLVMPPAGTGCVGGDGSRMGRHSPRIRLQFPGVTAPMK